MPTAEELFTRARNSVMDLLKLAMTLATGAIATFFLALTRTGTPPLSPDERSWGLMALVLMVGSVGVGLAAWGADATFYGAWGMSLYRGENELGDFRSRRELSQPLVMSIQPQGSAFMEVR